MGISDSARGSRWRGGASLLGGENAHDGYDDFKLVDTSVSKLPEIDEDRAAVLEKLAQQVAALHELMEQELD